MLQVAMASTSDETEKAQILTNTSIKSVLSREVNDNWWKSGNTRRLFAPCSILYGTDCDDKEIVLERIEILESVNCAAGNWTNVVDARTGCTC